MFRSKLTAKGWNVAIWLSKSLNQSLPCDAAQSFQIVGPLARHLGKLREKVCGELKLTAEQDPSTLRSLGADPIGHDNSLPESRVPCNIIESLWRVELAS